MEFNLAKAVRSTYDSVNLIADLIASGKTDAETKATVKRNWQHIEIVIAREEMQAMDAADKAAFEASVAAGKAFTA